MRVSTIEDLAAGDSIRIPAEQSSGVIRNASPMLAVIKLSN